MDLVGRLSTLKSPMMVNGGQGPGIGDSMLHVRLLALIVLLAVFAVAACGDDDDDGADTTASADVGRYCELTKQLDEAGSEAFRELEQDPEATEKDFEEAEADFVRQNEAELAELAELAPKEIQDDVPVLLAGLRGRAGLEEQPPDDQEVKRAERAIARFERENCPNESGES
jgi:hypothetical protein